VDVVAACEGLEFFLVAHPIVVIIVSCSLGLFDLDLPKVFKS